MTAEEALIKEYGEGDSRAHDYDVLAMMEEFAKKKCEEQRQLCFDQTVHHKFGFYKAKKDSILNAPEPKFRQK